MRVGFDLDGVLYDFGNSVRRYLDSIERQYGWKDDAPEPHDWNFFEYWGMDRDEFVQICHDGVDAGYIFQGDIRPNAKDAVKAVKAAGHQIVIITDRQFGCEPVQSHNATRAWLAEHGIVYDELYFSADKTVAPTDVFVEDKLENYDHLIMSGTPCALITRPWNIKDDMRMRINDISEYPEFVEEVARERALNPQRLVVL